jgi:hypothetical protein
MDLLKPWIKGLAGKAGQLKYKPAYHGFTSEIPIDFLNPVLPEFIITQIILTKGRQ